jgi:hypothetical protein
MDDLNIEFHYQQSRRLIGENLPETEVIRDLHMHALSVMQAVQDEYTRTIETAQLLSSSDARDYIIYGVGRRMGMLVYSFRSLIGIVQPGREKPLDGDEGHAISRDLNVVYINIVGVIDNLAWAILHERVPDAAKSLQAAQVGLFTQPFRRLPELKSLVASIDQYRAWFIELRNRRDPAAHRIPLYLPPAILNHAQVAQHNELTELGNEAIGRQDWAGWDEIMKRQRSLGRMYAVFMHSPREPMYHFYPTIPEDAGQMVKVIKVVREFLRG